MPGRQYRFFSSWLIEAPREPVFEALWESERWPQWWPGVVSASETDPGDRGTGLGRRGSYEWRSRIPYPVRFEVVATRIERPWLLEGEASGGMVGHGSWRLFEQSGLTAVTYEWSVRPGEPWMQLLAPLAAPVFRWNHDYVMAAGARGLATLLNARLVAAS